MSIDEFLREEFARRRGRNQSYSMRAFARDLKLSPTVLSNALSGKRQLSAANARRVALALNLPKEVAALLVAEAKISAGVIDSVRRRVLTEDEFAPIADWYHFAILSLARLPSVAADPASLAARLGIEPSLAEGALKRLIDQELVEIVDGALQRTGVPISTGTDIPSPSLRKFHRQNLELALLSLERDTVHEREVMSVTTAMNPGRLPEAKLRIQRFARSLARFLSRGPCTDVYTMTLALVPATAVERRTPGQDELSP